MKKRSQYFDDIVGKKFGRLTVIEVFFKPGNDTTCRCLCECGNETTKMCAYVCNGRVTNCGCRRKSFVHGMSFHPFYRAWRAIKSRCYCKKAKYYHSYGERGIDVCERWKNSFENFYEDMWASYRKGLSLDRIDVNKGYSKENCRWADRFTQDNNKASTIWIEMDGIKKPLGVWAKDYGISNNLVRHRIWDGWSAERAIKTPRKKIATSK